MSLHRLLGIGATVTDPSALATVTLSEGPFRRPDSVPVPTPARLT